MNRENRTGDAVEEFRVHFGEKLRTLRTLTGLSQQQLAVKMQTADSTVSDLERGKGKRTPVRDLVVSFIESCITGLAENERVSALRRAELMKDYETLATLVEQNSSRRRTGGAASSTGPSASAAVAVTETLPRDARAFTGRDTELDSLAATVELHAEHGGVIDIHAIDGMPGIGKTALAVHAGHQLAEQFPDGQLFMSLHGHTAGRDPVEPSAALASLLQIDGVDPTQMPADLEGRSTLWRGRLARRRMLLIFDDAASAEQVQPLVPGAPGCLVVVTSRRRLVGLDAVPIQLDVLTPKSAVTMFLRLAARPVADLESVAAIVELCGRLPLAIALVAGRFRVRRAMTVEVLRTDLESAHSRLGAMDSGDRAIHAAFTLSYLDLPLDRQSFFRQLGLHPGVETDVYAAAALSAVLPPISADHLDALYTENLLEEPQLGRYRMHALIREYARELAMHDAVDERESSVRRLVAHYRTAACRADSLLGPRVEPQPEVTDADCRDPQEHHPVVTNRAEAVAWFQLERDNLLSCLDWTARNGWHRQSIGFAQALTDFLHTLGPWDQLVQAQEAAITAARELGDPNSEARALIELGDAWYLLADYGLAEEPLQQALLVSIRHGDTLRRARALNGLSTVWRITDQFARAQEAQHSALEIFREIGNRCGEGQVLTELGSTYYLTDEYPKAEDALRQALAIAEELEDLPAQARVLKALGIVYYLTDRYPRAQETLGKALTLYVDQHNRLGEAHVHLTLGGVLRLTGQFALADEALTRALNIYRAFDERSAYAQALVEGGVIKLRLGDHESAEAMLRESEASYRVLGERMGLAVASKELGEMLMTTGELAEAAEKLESARRIYAQIEDRMGQAAVLNSIGTLFRLRGDTIGARDQFTAAFELASEIRNPLEEGIALKGIGLCALASNDTAGAAEALERSYARFAAIGSPEAEVVARTLHDMR